MIASTPLRLAIPLSFLIIALAACAPLESTSQAWIDHPLDGSKIPAGEPVMVVSHAFAKSGLAEIVLSVNGAPLRRDPPNRPGETSSDAVQEWLPPAEGHYTLHITAYGRDGSSAISEPVSVLVLSSLPVIPVTAEAVPELPTEVSFPDLAILNVEAVVIGNKGGIPICNTHVTYTNLGTTAIPLDFNIQFHFNGIPTLENTVAAGLPPGATAEHTFVYQFDGEPYIGINLDSTNLISESDERNNAFAEVRRCGTPVTITPSLLPTTAIPLTEVPPVTPAPPGDTTPPSPPTPAVPANGLELSCRSDQNLVWLPSTDSSGIAHYELRLERRAGGSWVPVNTWNNIHDKQRTVPVECGLDYRWSVRAVDSAGNFSAWSSWSTFGIQLP